MRRSIFLVPLIFLSAFAYSQQWKQHLDSGNLYQQTNYKQALRHYLLAREYLPVDSMRTFDYASIIYGIANCYRADARFKDAEPLYVDVKNIWEKMLGKEHPNFGECCYNLAKLYYQTGKYDMAEPLYLVALNMWERFVGKDNPEYAGCCNNIAILYFAMGQHVKAEKYYIQSKNTIEKAYGKNDPEYASSCNNLGALYGQTGQYQKAETQYLEAISIVEKTLGKMSEGYALLCNNLGKNYHALGQYEKAESLLVETKNIREKILGKDHPDYAMSCGNLGLVYFDMGQFQKVEPLYLEAKNITERTLGKEHPEYAAWCNNLAVFYSEMGNDEKAELLFLEAKSIREKALGKSHPDYGVTCNTLAILYKKQGRYEEAEKLSIEAMNIAENNVGKNSTTYAAACTNLAHVYVGNDQYKKAEALYVESKNILEIVNGKDHPDYAGSCNNLANFYTETGQYQKAEQLYLEAKKIIEKILGRDHKYVATFYNDLAFFYTLLGQYDKAELLYFAAKSIREAIYGKQNPEYAKSCNNLAWFYYKTGAYQKAESLYLEAKGIFDVSVGKENPEYAGACNNLASIYEKMGFIDKAEILYNESMHIREKVYGKQNIHYASSCNNIAVLYEKKGEYEKAEKLFLESIDIKEKILGKDHPDYVATCNNLGVLYRLMKKNEKADSLFRIAFMREYKQTYSVSRFASEKEKSIFINNTIGSNDLYHSFYYSQKDGSALYDISFLSRNLTLASSQQLRKAVAGNESLIKDYEQWASLKKQIAAIYSNGIKNTLLYLLENQANILEKSMAQSSSVFKEELNVKSWKDIQQHLKLGESAIEFVEFKYDNGKIFTDSILYVALLLRKDKPGPILIPLFEKKQLVTILQQTGNKNANDNVKELYASRGGDADDNVVLNKSLYSLVWKPIEKELQGISTIYFAPSGLLHRISFAALPVNDTVVLSDRYKLVNLASTVSVTDMQPLYIRASDKIILYGGITYNPDSSSLKKAAFLNHSDNKNSRTLPDDLTRSIVWKELAGTKKEVDEIAFAGKNFNNNISITSGINATEESIKVLEGKNSPVVLHIATHGFFFPDTKHDKEIFQNPSTKENIFRQSDDPLFRSGILFAGANIAWTGKAVNGIEDGILTSYEVSNMYLPNTKLVILSACETGLGDIKGNEGVYGLQRAFKMAGAESLIMSLWKVPDAETGEFMKELYKNIFAKQSVSDAFYNAQTVMKNRYRKDPYKWAAWILIR